MKEINKIKRIIKGDERIMLNQVIIVGRILTDSEKTLIENNKLKIMLAVPRTYKNADGEYETDFIDCILWNSVAKNTAEYCKKGDLVGIKGILQKSNEDEQMIVMAEKVTFLSSKKEVENE